MKLFQKSIFLLFFLALLSCNDDATIIKTNITSLKEIIQIDFLPESAKWTYSKIGGDIFFELGPTDYEVTAVLKLKKEDWNQLYQKYATTKKEEPVLVSKQFLKDWHPDSVKKHYKQQEDHMIIIKDIFAATQFSKGSLLNGFFFFTDHDEIFIHMYTT